MAAAVVTSLFESFPCFIPFHFLPIHTLILYLLISLSFFLTFLRSFVCTFLLKICAFRFVSDNEQKKHENVKCEIWATMADRNMTLPIFQVICNELPIKAVQIDSFKLI